jgi:hypothetical protein
MVLIVVAKETIVSGNSQSMRFKLFSPRLILPASSLNTVFESILL